eukprot:2735231-Pyramimonas_sp.AAC.1
MSLGQVATAHVIPLRHAAVPSPLPAACPRNAMARHSSATSSSAVWRCSAGTLRTRHTMFKRFGAL